MPKTAYCPEISNDSSTQDGQSTPSYPWLDESADLNQKHYPNVTGGSRWMMYTEQHLLLEASLTPCAGLLWKWVLLKAPAGTQVEINFDDFRAFSSEFREGKPYSHKQIRRAVSQLESFGLLVVSDERVKVLARHPGKVTNHPPGTKMSTVGTKMSTVGTKMSTVGTEMSISTPETLVNQERRNAPYITETYKAAADQEVVTAAAAAPKQVLEKPEVATPPKEEEQARDSQKLPRQERESQPQSQSTHEGQCSAAGEDDFKKQIETLRKLGIHPSRAVKEHLYSTDVETVEKAIALFQQDRATWQGPPMENPAGYFRTVLRDVIEGTREPLPGLQERGLTVDPVEEMLVVWRNRWFKTPFPHLREQFKRDIAAEFPNGEIVIMNDEVGPVRGAT
jgi:hypothetical protein